MEGKTQLGSRRTRFIDDAHISENLSDEKADDIFENYALVPTFDVPYDDNHLKNLSDNNADEIFENSTCVPTFAVLHDTVPNLGKSSKVPSVRISDPTPTLANLTAEFNDLSRKMTLLKETIKATRNNGTTKKLCPIQKNSSSQTFQACNITEVATAKLVLNDCIAELISVNHFLDGNEEIAAAYREKLRRAISEKHVKTEKVVIQGISLASNTYNPKLYEYRRKRDKTATLIKIGRALKRYLFRISTSGKNICGSFSHSFDKESAKCVSN